MPRKTTDNPAARTAAAELITSSALNLDSSEAGSVVAVFESAEIETATSRVGGQEIQLRRVVLTSPWEVIPGKPSA